MAKVFFIGATGYIGVPVIEAIASQRPDIEITALVQSEEKGKWLKERFPSVDPLIGTLDSVDLIEFASRDAGIVINTAPDVDHEATLAAITRGFSAIPTKGWYIHTSGAALLWEAPDASVASERVWDDIADIEQITSMSEAHIHAKMNRMLLEASSTMNVANVSPGSVYGLSTSRDHPTPLSINNIMPAIETVTAGFTFSKGANVVSVVHVNDLANIYIALLADALKGADFDPTLWGPQAYYFAESEELSFREFMEALVPVLKEKGVIGTDEIKEIDIQDPVKAIGERPDIDLVIWTKRNALMFGTDMRCRSSRARKLLGWRPQEKPLKETLPEVLEVLLRGKGTET